MHSPSGVAVSTMCNFAMEVIGGAGCGRNQDADVCWVLSIQTLASVNLKSCEEFLKQDSCARSTLQFYVYQVMDPSNVPYATCINKASGLGLTLAAGTSRVAGDLEAAFDVNSDTLCGANPYGADDGYRCAQLASSFHETSRAHRMA